MRCPYGHTFMGGRCNICGLSEEAAKKAYREADSVIGSAYREQTAPRFDKTYCSQCGGEFGPGEHGYSHCKDHKKVEQSTETLTTGTQTEESANPEVRYIHDDDSQAYAEAELRASEAARHTMLTALEASETRRKRLVAVLRELLTEAVILSEEYLSHFEMWPKSATIQGWDKARWLRALEAKKKAERVLEETNADARR